MIALFEGGPQDGRWTRRDVCCRYFEFPVLLTAGYAVDRYESAAIVAPASNGMEPVLLYRYVEQVRLRKRKRR